MKFLSTIMAAAGLAAAQQPNYATVDNWVGTTPSQRYEVNATQAQMIIQAAAEKAAELNIPQNIAVVNYYGSLVAFLHMDNSYPGSVDISIKKARTVVAFNGQLTSQGYYNASQPGGSLYGIEETNGGLVVFGGGIPIIVDGILYGGVGVSGGSVPQDVACAAAGVQAVGGYIPAN